MSDTNITLTLNTETIELYKILKLEGLVPSGAEAKLAIADGLVEVNGKIELRKRNKIKAGDIVHFDDHTISIVNG